MEEFKKPPTVNFKKKDDKLKEGFKMPLPLSADEKKVVLDKFKKPSIVNEKKEEEVGSVDGEEEKKVVREEEDEFKPPAVIFKKPPGEKRTSSEGKDATSKEEEKIVAEAVKEESNGESSVSGYIPPSWSGQPPHDDFRLEVLKNGVILDAISLNKPFLVLGRLPENDVVMEHPTSSRFHAVLQYSSGTAEYPAGYYIYDLDSTHGTFLNKARVKPRLYLPLKIGHMLKFGLSTRMYIFQGPDEVGSLDDVPEISYSELKQRKEEFKRLKEEKERALVAQEEARGIDWGMGDDADEEPDSEVNPFAVDNSANDECFRDPKKTLRGWFQREGHELEYDVEEKGYSKFLCRVKLPLEEVAGHPVTAEAEVMGKKKEAVVQCALEACKILDRYGVLRQALHESKAKKKKNWEEDDFYESDEDEFLDRTGSIERKRQLRMKASGKDVASNAPAETYETLVSLLVVVKK